MSPFGILVVVLVAGFVFYHLVREQKPVLPVAPVPPPPTPEPEGPLDRVLRRAGYDPKTYQRLYTPPSPEEEARRLAGIEGAPAATEPMGRTCRECGCHTNADNDTYYDGCCEECFAKTRS